MQCKDPFHMLGVHFAALQKLLRHCKVHVPTLIWTCLVRCSLGYGYSYSSGYPMHEEKEPCPFLLLLNISQLLLGLCLIYQLGISWWEEAWTTQPKSYVDSEFRVLRTRWNEASTWVVFSTALKRTEVKYHPLFKVKRNNSFGQTDLILSKLT